MGHSRWRRASRFVALLAVLALTAAACGGDDKPADDGGGEPGATLSFGTAADPVVLDGALVSDGESLRAIDQMFEGLVGLAPGGTEVVPALATEWSADDSGTVWTFNLRENVTFHDGTAFNADAVCFNFDRWYNFEGSFQNPSASYYWQTVFGGFANPDPDSGAPTESLYASCEASDDATAVITLTKPSASFLPALALTSFTIASPEALEKYEADSGEVDAEGIFHATGTFGTEHPIGTGAYMLEEWVRNDHLTMVRNPDWWGDFTGNVDTLIFQPIPDNAARLQALQSGDIQGYDLVEPQDFETITGDGLTLLPRPAFNVGYVGFNQAQKPFDDIAVRQAFAMAINRQEVVDAFYAGQGEVAKEFMPPSLFGYADDVTTYDYDPDAAKQLLEDAGYSLPVEINFAYPTDVSRPYMPSPQDNFEAMVSNLEDCCFKVKVESAVWSPNYLDNADSGRYGAYLLGWTGDFGDPDNFIGTFFQTEQPAWGMDDPAIRGCLDDAEVETDADARVSMYEECNRLIMDALPGIPYVHTKPALAFQSNVSGYVPSPVSLEPFSLVTVE
jgi:peptide/nickel transport system substrate-binding protein